MIPPPSHRCTRRSTSRLAGLLAVVVPLLVVNSAGTARADSTGTLSDAHTFSSVIDSNGIAYDTAVIVLSDGAGQSIDAYGVEQNGGINLGDAVVETPSGATAPSLTAAQWQKVRAILNHAGSVVTGSDEDRSAAIQAALWHISDAFEPSLLDNPPDLVANYQAIIAGLAWWSGPAVEPTLVLTGVTGGHVGDVVGPFAAAGVDAGVPLSIEVVGPATPVDADGNPIATIGVGAAFRLRLDGAGPVQVRVKGLVRVPRGTIYDAPGLQTVVVAAAGVFAAHTKLDLTVDPAIVTTTTTSSTPSTSSTSSSTVPPSSTSSTAPPSSTSSEPPSSTSSTEPPSSTSSTEPPSSTSSTQPGSTTSSTIPLVLGATVETGGLQTNTARTVTSPATLPTTLAVTGSNADTPFGAGVVFVALGLGLVVVARRRFVDATG